MLNLDEKIKKLEELKKKWYDKESELFELAKNYKGGSDSDNYDELNRKLDSIGEELKEIGKVYHQEINNVADEITKNYEDNPIIQKLVDGFKSDIDDNWNYYHGNRENRLRDLAAIIDIFDKLS